MAGLSFIDDPWFINPPAAIVSLPDDDLGGQELGAYIQDTIMPLHRAECQRLEMLEMWGTGKQPMDKRYAGQNKEKLVLMRFSRNPWLKLMVSTFSQQLIVDGFRKDGQVENEDAWDSWLANNMPAQQLTINRATSIYGYSYVRLTLGQSPLDESTMAIMRAIDPKQAFGIYRDPYRDDYPAYLLERRCDGQWWWWTPDEYSVFNKDGNDWTYVKTVPHDYKVVPFVRYVNEIDAEGRCWGDVEPLVEIAARLDKTVLDRLLVQHYNSFKIKYATGLEQPDTEEKTAAAAMKLAHDTVLISSNEMAKFGTITETDMSPFVSAYQSDLESFLTIAQLPPDLSGQVANIAADALEGARWSSYQKLAEKQVMLGQSHAQVLRLAAFIEGRSDEASDYSSRVHWQGIQIKSLAQFADAWGKICGQLGVPKWAAWGDIPGVSQADVEAWKEEYFNDTGEDGKLNKYLREMNIPIAGATPGQQGGPNSFQNQPKQQSDDSQLQ